MVMDRFKRTLVAGKSWERGMSKGGGVKEMSKLCGKRRRGGV